MSDVANKVDEPNYFAWHGLPVALIKEQNQVTVALVQTTHSNYYPAQLVQKRSDTVKPGTAFRDKRLHQLGTPGLIILTVHLIVNSSHVERPKHGIDCREKIQSAGLRLQC